MKAKNSFNVLVLRMVYFKFKLFNAVMNPVLSKSDPGHLFTWGIMAGQQHECGLSLVEG